MNLEHTPGPWLANRFDAYSPQTVISALGTWICRVSSNGNWAQQPPDIELANACLIAAAPDLLCVAREFVAQFDDDNFDTDIYDTPAITAARAAIKKAGAAIDKM